jgi:hypothetical protein
MDFITPLPKTARGNAGLFVVVDRLSKLIRIATTPAHADAPEVAVYSILTSIDTTDFLLRSSLIVIPYL